MRKNLLKANQGKKVNVRRLMEGRGGYIQQSKEMKALKNKERSQNREVKGRS